MIGGTRPRLGACLLVLMLGLAGCGSTQRPPAVLSATVTVGKHESTISHVKHAGVLVPTVESAGFVYSLSSRGVCTASDGVGLFTNAGDRPVRISRVALRVSGIAAKNVATRFRLVHFAKGRNPGEVTVGLKPRLLLKLPSTPARGALVRPERSSHLEYDVLGYLHVRHLPVRAWRITGVIVSYRTAGRTVETILPQHLHLPAVRTCAR